MVGTDYKPSDKFKAVRVVWVVMPQADVSNVLRAYLVGRPIPGTRPRCPCTVVDGKEGAPCSGLCLKDRPCLS